MTNFMEVGFCWDDTGPRDLVVDFKGDGFRWHDIDLGELSYIKMAQVWGILQLTLKEFSFVMWVAAFSWINQGLGTKEMLVTSQHVERELDPCVKMKVPVG